MAYSKECFCSWKMLDLPWMTFIDFIKGFPNTSICLFLFRFHLLSYFLRAFIIHSFSNQCRVQMGRQKLETLLDFQIIYFFKQL